MTCSETYPGGLIVQGEGLVDFAFSQKGGLSHMHTLDKQIAGLSSDGQILDAATEDKDTLITDIGFVDFILCK